jgi:hypothetical protein
MRRPKQPGTKRSPDETQPPGGRAWERAKQFALERGLPLPVKPPEEKKGDERTSKTSVRRAKKSGKRA